MVIDFIKVLHRKLEVTKGNLNNKKMVRQIYLLYEWEKVMKRKIRQEKREKKNVEVGT